MSAWKWFHYPDDMHLLMNGESVTIAHVDGNRSDLNGRNMRLIASAPDLLAELKAMCDPCYTAHSAEPHVCAFSDARELIRRIEGEP